MSVTELRAKIYKVIDEVIESGQPVQIQRGDKQVWITPVPPSSEASKKPKRRFKLEDRLIRRDHLAVGDWDKIAEIDWSDTWSGLDFDIGEDKK